MLFSSITFIYWFLPVVLLVYYGLLRKKRILQNIFLLVSSLFFYGWGEPKFVLLMVLSVIINWLFGLLIDRKRENRHTAKLLMIADIVLNLSVLFIFKYLTFTVNIIESIFGIDTNFPSIELPIGISFFTFQAISYVIDVYRKKAEVQKNILYVGLYISLFPQLIAGPIVRYETIADEIVNRKENSDDVFNGFARFVKGLSKKVLLANSFALLADRIFLSASQKDNISVLLGWLGAVAYTLQIFFDFSGYSDMAIGLGKMFGFHFSENFNYPYISKSVSEFWRRWHISLGTWFRDYVYIPLGGSRVSRSRNIFNLFAVWLLTGIWHGANFTFIVWGLIYFVLISAEKLTGFEKKDFKFAGIFKHIYTMLFVVLGWVIFRSETLGDAFYYIGSMFGLNGNPIIDNTFKGCFIQNIILLVIGLIFCAPVAKLFQKTKIRKSDIELLNVIILIVLFVLSIASIAGNAYNPFIYFNF